MAITFKTSAIGAKEMVQDLEAIQIGLGKELAKIRREAASSLARQTAVNTPVGPGPQSAKDNLPHIRDTIRSRGASVISTHPAALVHEFGGTIRPRGNPIEIHRSAMADRAAKGGRAGIERDMAAALDGLLDSTLR